MKLDKTKQELEDYNQEIDVLRIASIAEKVSKRIVQEIESNFFGIKEASEEWALSEGCIEKLFEEGKVMAAKLDDGDWYIDKLQLKPEVD